jgi:hypothetical protein
VIHGHVVRYYDLVKICGTGDKCYDFKAGDADFRQKIERNLNESMKWLFRLTTGTTCNTFKH